MNKRLGGQSSLVETDEAKLGKIKYNRGRIVIGQWVLGGVTKGTKEKFFPPFVILENVSGIV